MGEELSAHGEDHDARGGHLPGEEGGQERGKSEDEECQHRQCGGGSARAEVCTYCYERRGRCYRRGARPAHAALARFHAAIVPRHTVVTHDRLNVPGS